MGDKRPQHFVDRDLKVRWLMVHRELWEAWIHPGDPRRQRLVETMRDAGLYSPTTYWRDIAVNNLIQEARQRLRESK